MTKAEAKNRIQKLKEEINRYRYAYHVLNREEISASALDSLKKELYDLENRFPEFVTPDSPTQRVGGEPLKAFKKVRHETPMLSFNDAFSEEDVRDWVKRMENYLGIGINQQSQRKSASYKKSALISQNRHKSAPNFYCELKIDGLAVELVYIDGILAEGSTRGDGIVGEDVTANLKTIEAIPLSLNLDSFRRKSASGQRGPAISFPGKLIARGEVFLSKKEFERINEEQLGKKEKTYANPRNVAAGSVRQLDPKISASRKLDLIAYDLVSDLGQETHEEEHEILRKLGFKTSPHCRPAKNLEEVFEFKAHWERRRDELPYEIDGIVVVVNDNGIFEKLGARGKAPRGAIAYKFSPKETATKILGIKVQVGRTGILTPVAVLSPVSVGGVTIAHATLHNFEEIGRLDVKIGDTVIVQRAGDVIPKVVKVLKNLRTGGEKNFKIPSRCPMDNSVVVREGALYRCSNPKCGAVERRFLRHFVSRAAFDIRGLGGKIIERFLNEGLITDAADIFTLTEGNIAVLERFGEKSAQNLIYEIRSRKIISLPRFLYSLGILHIGEETSRLLAGKFEILNSLPVQQAGKFEIRDFLKQVREFTIEELQEIPDIGPIVARSVYDWFREPRNIKLLQKLDKVGVRIESQGSDVRGQRLAGLTFVLTGVLESMTHEGAKEKIRSLGGDVSESVSGKTDYVVVGRESGSKHEKARKMGIKTLNEQKFLKMLKPR